MKGLPHTIDRSNTYEDVDLYRECNIVCEYPIIVKYVGEKIWVCRGTCFWHFGEKACSVLFEGVTTLIPMVHPQIDLSVYSIVGRILSHSYYQQVSFMIWLHSLH